MTHGEQPSKITRLEDQPAEILQLHFQSLGDLFPDDRYEDIVEKVRSEMEGFTPETSGVRILNPSISFEEVKDRYIHANIGIAIENAAKARKNSELKRRIMPSIHQLLAIAQWRNLITPVFGDYLCHQLDYDFDHGARGWKSDPEKFAQSVMWIFEGDAESKQGFFYPESAKRMEIQGFRHFDSLNIQVQEILNSPAFEFPLGGSFIVRGLTIPNPPLQDGWRKAFAALHNGEDIATSTHPESG